MCGIAGYYNAKVEQMMIEKVLSGLAHRGPDDQQYFKDKDVGLLHTRLSILELSKLGAQPYHYKDLSLVLNGELYNYREVREELKKSGYAFQSNSDTEVLIKAFHQWGVNCVDRFIGMFAFAVYDREADELFLFRDRVGVKPLYYSYLNKRLFFASELKVFDAFPIERQIDPDAIALYFRFGFIPKHLSVFRSVAKLEAGHYIRVTRTSIEKKQYWKLEPANCTDNDHRHWVDELESLLISSFRYRMISDVPVGIFLSGGIDSSLLTSILQRHEGNIRTFTIGFSEAGFDESTYAKNIARQLGTTHAQRILTLPDARNMLSKFYDIYDEPFADTSGIPVTFVAQLAKENGVKVVLSADGGDELFCGYTHYPKALQLYTGMKRLPPGIRRGLSRGAQVLFPKHVRKKITWLNLEHKSYALEEILEAEHPAEFFEAIIANQSADELSHMLPGALVTTMNQLSIGNSPLQTMMQWDFQYYLPDDLLVKIDRATMYHGIECREPFLDHRLIEFSAKIPMELKMRNGTGKYILREVLARYLPGHFFNRKKQGFSIPVFDWFSKDLDKMFAHYFSDEHVKSIPLLDAREIQREYKKYLLYKKARKPYNVEKMWRILSFVLWCEKYRGNGI